MPPMVHMPYERYDRLLACLRSFARPAEVEAWLVDGKSPAQGSGGPPIPPEYRQAVHDLLAVLGVISPQTGHIASAMGYHFVQSLLRTAEENALTPDNWQGAPGEGCSGTGASMVQLIEKHRLTCIPDAEPLRLIQAVMAIIKARRGNTDVYLMQYDHGARQFQPIGGKREASDTDNEATLVRELHEELSLERVRPGHDFRVEMVAEHVRIRAISASTQILTHYEHSFYQLLDVRFPLNTDALTRWISATELANGRTEDGYAISMILDDYLPGILPRLTYSLPEIEE